MNSGVRSLWGPTSSGSVREPITYGSVWTDKQPHKYVSVAVTELCYRWRIGNKRRRSYCCVEEEVSEKKNKEQTGKNVGRLVKVYFSLTRGRRVLLGWFAYKSKNSVKLNNTTLTIYCITVVSTFVIVQKCKVFYK